jgi:hypothetical protein
VLTDKIEAVMITKSEFISLSNGGKVEDPSDEKIQKPGSSKKKTRVPQQRNPPTKKI